jgi:hemerythrin-like domain-containing protein
MTAQLRLPGQTAAHEGPVDMHMMYVMHHAFRRDLTAFVAAAALTPSGDRATWQALAQRWELFSTALHHHHAGEDAGLWPRLLEVADDEGRATLEAMEAEHEEIDPMLESCAAGFARLAEHEDEDARRALAVRLVAARESLARHLAHEEGDAIALVQQHLTDEEWLALEEEHFRAKLSLGQVLALVSWVAHELPADARSQVFGKAGLPFRVLWLVGRRSFRRRERAAFRYVVDA